MGQPPKERNGHRNTNVPRLRPEVKPRRANSWQTGSQGRTRAALRNRSGAPGLSLDGSFMLARAAGLWQRFTISGKSTGAKNPPRGRSRQGAAPGRGVGNRVPFRAGNLPRCHRQPGTVGCGRTWGPGVSRGEAPTGTGLSPAPAGRGNGKGAWGEGSKPQQRRNDRNQPGARAQKKGRQCAHLAACGPPVGGAPPPSSHRHAEHRNVKGGTHGGRRIAAAVWQAEHTPPGPTTAMGGRPRPSGTPRPQAPAVLTMPTCECPCGAEATHGGEHGQGGGGGGREDAGANAPAPRIQNGRRYHRRSGCRAWLQRDARGPGTAPRSGPPNPVRGGADRLRRMQNRWMLPGLHPPFRFQEAAIAAVDRQPDGGCDSAAAVVAAAARQAEGNAAGVCGGGAR